MAKHLHIAQIRQARLLTLARILLWHRERSEQDGRVGAILPHELVQNQMLRSTGQVVKGKRKALGGIARARFGVIFVLLEPV